MQPSRQTSIPKAQSRQPSAEVSQQEALETAQSASWQHDSLLSPIGTIANPSAHAELLQRASLGQSSSPSQFLLQLQRRYGNRYVNQVLQRSQQPNSTAISTTPSALEQSIPPKHPIAPEHRSNTANPPVSENLGIPVIQRKKGGSKEAPKTTHQPTANQPAPLNSTWQNAPLLNDPKLRVEHQRVIDDAKAKNQNWYLMPGATVAPMNGGAIGQPTPLGNKNPEPVTEKQDVTSFKISQGTQIYSTASFKLLPQLTTHDVEVVPQPKSQDDQGNAGYVVNFPFAGPNSIALPLWFYEAALQPGVQGHLIRSGRTPYWIAQNNAHLQQLNAFIDRTQEPLFPEDPTPEQVLQGELGDCYLMAALASITQANPDFPKEMMLDNNNGTVTVRLYEISHAGFFKPFKATKRLIRVNKSAPHKQGKDVYAREYLWVQMVEKAYAASGIRGNLLKEKSNEGAYENMEGGFSWYAFEVLLGKESSQTDLTAKKAVKKSRSTPEGAKPILAKIKAALDNKKAVAAGTRPFTEAEKKDAIAEKPGHSGGEAKLRGIVARHEYTILDINEQEKMIKLRNPWGFYGRNDDPQDWSALQPDKQASQAEQNKTGVFWIGLDDFLNWFDRLSISAEVSSLSKDKK